MTAEGEQEVVAFDDYCDTFLGKIHFDCHAASDTGKSRVDRAAERLHLQLVLASQRAFDEFDRRDSVASVTLITCCSIATNKTLAACIVAVARALYR